MVGGGGTLCRVDCTLVNGADWLRDQLSTFGCAACGRTYLASHIRVLAERDDVFFVDLTCQMCGAQTDAIVTIEVEADATPRAEVGELAETGGWVRRQLETSEPGADRDDGPITADDVIEMHEYLRDFDGDFAGVLSGRGSAPRERA